VQARDGAVQVDVVSAQARVGDGALLARGRWRSDGQFEAQWLLENAALDALVPYLPVEYRFAGRATVQGEASGTPNAPNVRVQLQGNQIALNGALLGDVEGWAAFEANPSTRYATPAGVILQQGEQEVENPLLKVPPVNRGNRASAWFGSPREAGETLRGAILGSPREAGGAFQGAILGSPREAGGTSASAWFGSPREAGGTLRRGAVQDFSHTGQSGGNLTADFTLRTPDGEARLTLHECNLQRQQVRLTAETSALPIEWLQRVVRAVPDALPPAVAERIETLQGTVQASLSLEGALREPLAQLRLNAEQLAWRQQPLGSVNLQAEWVGAADAPDAETDLARAVETVRRLRTQRAALQQLRWQAETARLEAQARYTPERLTADLEVAQLPLRWARLWEPSLPEVDGALDLSLIADGVPESPELTLSATVNQLAYAGYTVDQILFSQIEVREGAIQTDDALIRMGDYQARLSGRLPFHWSPISHP
jgi:autotransporter translocation and assembly factor TamB